jgi:hypothetical protein
MVFVGEGLELKFLKSGIHQGFILRFRMCKAFGGGKGGVKTTSLSNAREASANCIAPGIGLL